MMHILFVCTGNTCRSPLAEAMLRRLAQEAGLALEVRSAGVSTVDGLPVSQHSREVLRRKGITDTTSSNTLTDTLVRQSDLILTMTTGHKRAVIQAYPEAVDRTFTLKEYVLDDAETRERLAKASSLMSELQMKAALGEPVTDAERAQAAQLERSLPSFDIHDPFGGSYEEYEACAAEIEDALRRLTAKLGKHR